MAWALERKIWVFKTFSYANRIPGYQPPSPNLSRLEAATHCANDGNNVGYYPRQVEHREKSPIRLLWSGDHYTPIMRCTARNIAANLDLAVRNYLVNQLPSTLNVIN